MIHPALIEKCLATEKILVDTREQPTELALKRWNSFGCPWERHKLNFGDYSAEFTLADGTVFSLAENVAVERKMSLDELSMCFCQERDRFEREFLRAKEAGARTYLLIEGASFESIYAHTYKTKMSSASMLASIITWLARYDCKLIFCQARTSGKLIADILKYEAREQLLKDWEGLEPNGQDNIRKT